MKKYDLHIHSTYSPCSINTPETILKTAKKIALDGIAITDHNTVKGAQKIKKLNKDKDFEVIIGEEIKTNLGEIIALYVQKEIRKNNLLEAIDEARSQGCIIIIAHPFRLAPWQRFRYPIEKLAGKVDAIETFNSRNILLGNKKADKIAQELNFAKIGSSDAHLPIDIGKGYTLFEGNLRDAIKKRATIAKGTTLFGLSSILISSINKRILSPLKVKKE